MATQSASVKIRYEADKTDFDRKTQQVKRSISDLTSGMGKQFQSVGADVSKLGAGLTAFGGLMTGALYKSTQAAIGFESAFAGVIKTVDGTTAQLDELNMAIRNMATDANNPLAGLEDAAVSIAKIMELGGQLGVPIDNLQGFAQVIGELTLATDLTAESAALMLAQFASITGMPFGDFDRLGSTIVALGNNMATTESAIVEFMQRLAGAGASFGFTEAQLVALSASMASVGLNAEAGGTAMTMVFTKMSDAVVSGGIDLQRFAKVAGITSADFANAWQNEPIVALEDFIIGLGEMDAATRELALGELGLDGIRVADALRRMSNDAEGFSEALGLANTAWNENNALSNEAQKRLATTEAQMNVLKNTVNDLAIEVGSALLPAVNGLVADLGPVIKSITGWIRENPRLVIGVGALALAVTTLGAGLTALGFTLVGIGFLISSPFLLPILAATAAVGIFAAAVATNFMGIRDAAERYLKPAADFLSGFAGAFGIDLDPQISNMESAALQLDADIQQLVSGVGGGTGGVTATLDITVEPGDTIWGISQETGLDQEYLMQVFGIDDPRKLRPGEYSIPMKATMDLTIDQKVKKEQMLASIRTAMGDTWTIQQDVTVEPTIKEPSAFESGLFNMIVRPITSGSFATSIGEALREQISSGFDKALSGEGLIDREDVKAFMMLIPNMIYESFTALNALDNLAQRFIIDPFIEGLLGFTPSEAFNTFVSNIETALTELDYSDINGLLSQAGSDMGQAVVDGIKSKAEEVLAAIQGLVPSSVEIKWPKLSLPDPMSLIDGSWIDNITPTIVVGGGSSSDTLSWNDAIGGAKAMGGNVMAGTSYLVGEDGPEIFKPATRGQIVPNHRMNTAGAGGGNGTTVILNNPIFNGVQDIQNFYDRLKRFESTQSRSAGARIGR